MENKNVMEKESKHSRRIGLISFVILLVGAAIGFVVWNNTDGRLLVRGKNALAKGNEEKAKSLFRRAEETNGEAAFRLWEMVQDNTYLKKAAGLGYLDAYGLYGEQLMKDGAFPEAIPYLQKALLPDSVSQLKNASSKDFLPSKYDFPKSYIQYLLGCAYSANQNWNEAREVLKSAAEGGYMKANVQLGDRYLCRGYYGAALKYYEKVPADWPGIKEKKRVIKELQEYDFEFSQERVGDIIFKGERTEDWFTHRPKSIRRGVAYDEITKCLYFGRFDSKARMMNGLGIIANHDGRIYVGNIRVERLDEGYIAYYSGKGFETDPSTGTIVAGQWKDNELVGSYAVTDIFGNTKIVDQ